MEVAKTGGVLLCPPGIYLFNPAVHKIVMGSNMRLTGGCQIRVSPHSGDYMYLISARTPTTHVENVSIDGIIIDQDPNGNITSHINPSDARTQQAAILFFDVQNIAIRDVRLNVAGVNSITCNGPAVENVQVEHNFIRFEKRAEQHTFDNSAIYLDGTNFRVANNVFEADSDRGAVTAIEVHTGAGSIFGNVVAGFSSGIIAASTHDTRIKNNIIAQAQVGISLWSTGSSGSTNTDVSGNSISLNNGERASRAPGGIVLWHGNESTGAFKRLTIADNIVLFEPEDSRDMAGYDTWGIGLESNGDVQDVTVKHNIIVGAPIRGIKVGAVNGGSMSHITVNENTIVNAGTNRAEASSGYCAAIAMDGELTGVEILDNTIVCTGAACQSFGVFGSDRQNHFHDIRVRGNNVQADDGREYSLPPSVRVEK